jgi:hypothetical protein
LKVEETAEEDVSCTKEKGRISCKERRGCKTEGSKESCNYSEESYASRSKEESS